MSIRAWHSFKLRSQASDSILRWQELPEGLEWSSVVGFFFFFYNEASADLLLPGESGSKPTALGKKMKPKGGPGGLGG